ncbi:superoxide dismutase family protein [Streptomyces sp. NPDC091272]|uniref:superoxide dismutase family protein n=1 Tax=Streptomyces sp. NPDC091272 TaxID=3365981 RepID=UPI0038115011
MTGLIQRSRRARNLGAAVAVAALFAGTAGTAAAVPADGGDGGRGGDVQERTVDDDLVPVSAFEPPGAVTYDQALAPAGGWIQVRERKDRKGTTVTVRVRGLKPDHPFGMHVHQKPCGVDPEAAGKHYQHVSDPNLVNDENEVWLDFTTNGSGDAEASAHHAWGLPKGAAGSVVLHREQGGAGDRVGCLTVPFGDFVAE